MIGSRRPVFAWSAVVFFLSGTPAAGSAIGDYLRDHGRDPVDYVSATALSHRITILGEAHWLAQDVGLVDALVPRLREAGIDLATEFLPAAEQSRIDALVSAPRWDAPAADAVMRAAGWPYVEYRDLLRTVWTSNRHAERPQRLVALGPPADWRETLLPNGATYDSFMADLVAKHVEDTGRRVLVYCGMHHAFTRYYQADLDLSGHVRGFMDRMGNRLSRRFGDGVFLIALHRPFPYGGPGDPSSSYRLPFGGRVDCEAARIGRSIGFDVVGSPLAELAFEPDDYYVHGHPALRFVDYADGYVWPGPIESFRPVSVIPLDEYAPDAATLAEVARANPLTDEKNVGLPRLREIWAEEEASARDFLVRRRWSGLVGWRARCG